MVNQELNISIKVDNMKLVYVIYSFVNQSIKVGYTSNINQRFSQIQLATAEPLKLLFTFEGGRQEEKELHYILTEYKLRGEWFTYSETVLDIILNYFKQKVFKNSLLIPTKTEENSLQDIDVYHFKKLTEYLTNVEKQFTIPEIKKKLPDLTLSTKQVENILLLNGFSFKQYGASRKKYFYREFH